MFDVDDIKISILIVDDESSLREVLHEFLGDKYNCLEVNSAEEAQEVLRQADIAVVISDIYLQGMSGLELLRYIKEESPETLVLLMSGEKSIENAIDALRVGAFDYIHKPFDLMQIEASLKRAVETYELRIVKKRYDQHLQELVSQRTTELDHALEEIENSYRLTLKALVQALETRDFETHGHSERVVTFSLRLGYELGLEHEKMRALEFGALLHDIGKIGVPDVILRKPSKLDEEEWKKMRLHPIYGQQILRDIPFLEDAVRVVSQHHEKWDGTGYPLGLKGADIDINARIFAVVDAFDAMISDRVYRKGRPYEAALVELEDCAGSQFDPHIVEMFKQIPREDWEALRQHSLMRRSETFSLRTVVSRLIAEKQTAAMVS